MKTYSVDFARYWHYVVEADDRADAETKALRIHRSMEGENARIDDELIVCIDAGKED